MPQSHPSASAILAGPLPLTLPDALSASGITPASEPTAPILITTGPEAATTARDFAHAVPPGQDALIVTLLADTPPDHAGAAQHWAFTRQAALDWAPRRIRVNAIALGADPMIPARPQPHSTAIPSADIAATIRLMWRLPSMTGQLIRLGPP